MKRAPISSRRRARKRSGRTRRPSAPGSCCSSPARSRSIRPPARSSTATSPRRRAASREHRRLLDAGGPLVRRRRPHDGLPRRHERFRGDERGLRPVLLRAVSGAGDRAGRAAAEGRARRNRRRSRSTTSDWQVGRQPVRASPAPTTTTRLRAPRARRRARRRRRAAT